LARKGYFYPVTKSTNMTFTSDLAAFSALTQDDLYTIIDALQAKVRSTEAFIHNQIDPVKDQYPTLFKAYSKQLDNESATLHRFKAIIYDKI
jgi:hypothetical protein